MKLSTEETRAFNARLSSDPAFKKDYEDFQLASQLMMEHDLQKFKVALDNLDYSEGTNSNWGRISIISSIVIAIVAGTALISYFGTNEPNTEPAIVADTSSTGYIQKQNERHSDTNTPNRVIVDIIELEEAPEPQEKEAVSEDKTDTLITTTNTTEVVTTESENKTINYNETNTSTDDDVDSSKVDCELVSIRPKITFSAPCFDQDNGYLNIDNISGGSAPYTVMVNDDSNGGSYEGYYLEAGVYDIRVQDQNGCSFDKALTIDEKRCLDESVLISPSLGNNFEIPTKGYEELWLKIQDPNNKTVFEKTYEDYEEKVWTGVNNSDEPLSSGIYFFIIKFADERKTYTGQIEIR